jgi:hypothetical protein
MHFASIKIGLALAVAGLGAFLIIAELFTPPIPSFTSVDRCGARWRSQAGTDAVQGNCAEQGGEERACAAPSPC